MAAFYRMRILEGRMTAEEVPARWRAEVALLFAQEECDEDE